MTEQKKDLAKSTRCFKKLVLPVIQKSLGGGRFFNIEGLPEELSFLLDARAGIDWVQVHLADGVRGIASRVQATSRPYNTFSVRTERESGVDTEFIKLCNAINSADGALYPAFFIQAYVRTWDDGPLLSVGIARTRDVIECIQRGWCDYKNVYKNGAAKFAVVRWKKMKGHGYPVTIIQPQPMCHQLSLLTDQSSSHGIPNMTEAELLEERYHWLAYGANL